MDIQTIDPIVRQQKVILQLQKDKRAYPHPVSKIKLEETHISWIFLTGKYAYKVKKKLKFGKVLDFSTLPLRRKFCQKEVALNKLLCPDMYKGVVKIVKEDDGSITIRNLGRHHDHDTRTLEYAVKMKEIPQKFRMDNLICKNSIGTKTITRLVNALVKFHYSTPTNARIMRFGQPKILKMKILENFNTLSKLANIHPKFKRELISFIASSSDLFYQRIIQAKVRDIHGDLYLKNIFIVQHKFYLYDRIEFNDSLRYADVAEDVAHICTDLDHYRRADLRNQFLSQYMKKSNDNKLGDLIYFWMCYKACVRAKVAFFRAKNEINNQRQATNNIKEAEDHLRLATSYLELF
jgi:aminoglycoside phosphotransferase family enzyme